MENDTRDILRLENTLPPNPVAIAPSKSRLPSLAILTFRIEAPLGKVTLFTPSHYTWGGRGESPPARLWPGTTETDMAGCYWYT